jgi:hypothetical protein
MSISAPPNSHRHDRSPALKCDWLHFQKGQSDPLERQPDQAVGGDDRGEVDLERRDRKTLGRGGQVHANQLGIGGKGRQAEADAPGVVLAER